MNKPLRLYRPLTNASENELAPFKEMRRQYPHQRVFPRKVPSTTIIAASDAQSGPNAESRSLQDVLYPLPETGEQLQTFEVIDLAYIGQEMGSRVVALLLDDPEGILESERLEYFRRMKRPVPETPFVPHVSLFNISALDKSERIMNWAASRVPPRISLLKLATHVPPSAQQQKPRSRPKGSAAQSTVKVDVPIRRLGPPIPQAMLNNIRSPKPMDGQVL